MTLQHTSLNVIHRSLGVHMVDFGGWDMSANYGSQIEEHHAVCQDAGVFDVSHMCVVGLTGVRVRDSLRGLLASSVDKLQTPGKALYSCMLNPKGGMIDDLIVYSFREDQFRLVINAGTVPTDLKWIVAQNAAVGTNVTTTPCRSDNNAGAEPLGTLAVQGPNARTKTYAALPGSQAVGDALKSFNAGFVTVESVDEITVARIGYTGKDGFELVVPAAQIAGVRECLLQAGACPAGLGACDMLRLEAGMNLYGQDMDEYVLPFDAGLTWTVNPQSERDFAGKAALQTSGQREQFVGLILCDRDGVLRAHQKVIIATGDGEITSGTFSPSLPPPIALVCLPKDVAVGTDVQIEVRDRRLTATVVKLPFMRNGKAPVS